MARTHVPKLTRMQRYFAANPNDWLTVEDAMVKFDMTYVSARRMLALCTATGSAVRVSVYRSTQVSEQVSAEVSK